MLFCLGLVIRINNEHFLKSISFFPGDEITSSNRTAIVAVSQNVAGTLEDSSGNTISFGFASQPVIMGEPIPKTIDEVVVYPNPIKPGSGCEYDSDYLYISGLTEGAEVSIYNIAGEKIVDLENISDAREIQWDLRNQAGRKAASGVYIFYITDDDGNSTSGRFGLVR